MITISSTGYGTFKLCPRRWAFTFAFGMPTQRHAHFALGSALHACVERYLWAPDGRVPEHNHDKPGDALYGQKPGDPIEMFPEAPGMYGESDGNRWWEVRERDGSWQSVPSHKREAIRAMVANGIEQGTIQHLRGGIPEVKFSEPLCAGAVYTSLVDYSAVEMGQVQDHKTYSASYKKSGKDLSVDGQLLAYGMWLLRERDRQGMPLVDRVQLRHNQFNKNTHATSVCYAEDVPDYPYVSRETIERNWTKIIDVGEAAVALVANHKDPEQWEEIQGPEPGSNACNSYGKPCDFLAICNKQQTVAEWTTRASSSRALAEAQTTFFESIHTPNTMTANNPLANTSPTRRMAPLPASGTGAPPKLLSRGADGDFRLNMYEFAPNGTARVVGVVPWRDPDCLGCKGVGIKANTEACPQCVGWTTRQGGREDDLPSGWSVGFDDDGEWFCSEIGAKPEPVYAEVQDDDEDVPEPPQKLKRGPGRPRKDAAAPKPEPAAPKPAEKEVRATESVAPTIVPPQVPPASFTLLIIGSVPSMRGFAAQDLMPLISEARGQLGANTSGGYFAMDGFKRRDMLAQAAKNIWKAATDQGSVVYLSAPDFDMALLLSQLRSMADVVVEAGGGK